MTQQEIRPYFDLTGSFVVKFHDTTKPDFYGFFTGDIQESLKNKWRMVSKNNAIKFRETQDQSLTVMFNGDDIFSISQLPY
jgi:hypothetical protein